MLYQPLTTATEFRLLKLLPGEETSLISTKLVCARLDDSEHPPYEAISYTWGTSLAQKTILVDNEETQIRENLWTFLLRLRAEHDGSRCVWVDALCIDQTNLAEKAGQVRMIGRIFKEATRILAWVGEHRDGSETLFGPRSDSGSRVPSKPPDSGVSSGISRSVRSRHSRENQLLRMDVWTAFLKRPYWNRTWIVQEIAVARSITLFCGNSQMNWDQLISSRIRPHSYSEGEWASFDDIDPRAFSPDFERASSPLRNLIIQRGWEQDRDQRSLTLTGYRVEQSALGIAASCRNTLCHDARDRVYACLWLERQSVQRVPQRLTKSSPHPEFPEILPDYEMNIVDLFVSVCLSRLKLGFGQELYDNAVCVATFFRSLRLGRNDALKVVDFLLDDYDMEKYGLGVFQVMACGLDQTKLFGTELAFHMWWRPGRNRIKKTLQRWRTKG